MEVTVRSFQKLKITVVFDEAEIRMHYDKGCDGG